MCYYSWLYWSFVTLCMLGILVSVVLERVSSSGPPTMAVNTPTTSTSAVRSDLQGWLLPSSSTCQATSATQHSLSVPLMASAPGPVSQPADAPSPSSMQMPIPYHTVKATAMDSDVDPDSSDDASNDGTQLYNPTLLHQLHIVTL